MSLRFSVGEDYVEASVERDPVTLRWEWRGYTRDESDRELADSQAEAIDAARAWCRKHVEKRAKQWAAIAKMLKGAEL